MVEEIISLADMNLLKMLPPVPLMESPGGYGVQKSREHTKIKEDLNSRKRAI